MMDSVISEQLPSKKNYVYLERGEQQDVVIKIFTEQKRFLMEKEVGDLLLDSGIATPARLAVDENTCTIMYQYIDAPPVVDLIENIELIHAQEIIKKICDWLMEFYSITWSKTGCQYILGDIHLRNFIFDQKSRQVYGLDFEECRIGRMESDAARLYVFILHYDPAFTPRKKGLANSLWGTLFSLLGLDESFFQQEVKRETAELINRRTRRDITRSGVSK